MEINIAINDRFDQFIQGLSIENGCLHIVDWEVDESVDPEYATIEPVFDLTDKGRRVIANAVTRLEQYARRKLPANCEVKVCHEWLNQL